MFDVVWSFTFKRYLKILFSNNLRPSDFQILPFSKKEYREVYHHFYIYFFNFLYICWFLRLPTDFIYHFQCNLRPSRVLLNGDSENLRKSVHWNLFLVAKKLKYSCNCVLQDPVKLLILFFQFSLWSCS